MGKETAEPGSKSLSDQTSLENCFSRMVTWMHVSSVAFFTCLFESVSIGLALLRYCHCEIHVELLSSPMAVSIRLYLLLGLVK